MHKRSCPRICEEYALADRYIYKSTSFLNNSFLHSPLLNRIWLRRSFKKSFHPVCMVIMRMRQHCVICLCNVDPQFIRIFQKQIRRSRIQKDAFVLIFDENTESPFAPHIIFSDIIDQYCRFHSTCLLSLPQIRPRNLTAFPYFCEKPATSLTRSYPAMKGSPGTITVS